MESFGRPGGSLSNSGRRYDPGAVEGGIVGELATAKLIEQIFATEPDVHVFHDLRIPGQRPRAPATSTTSSCAATPWWSSTPSGGPRFPLDRGGPHPPRRQVLPSRR